MAPIRASLHRNLRPYSTDGGRQAPEAGAASVGTDRLWRKAVSRRAYLMARTEARTSSSLWPPLLDQWQAYSPAFLHRQGTARLLTQTELAERGPSFGRWWIESESGQEDQWTSPFQSLLGAHQA